MVGSRAFIFAVALVVMALPACGEALLAPEDLPEGLRAPELTVSGWECVDRGAFSFALPDGFEKLDVTPIDSDAAVFVRGEDALSYDYGAYGGPWRPSENEPIGDVREAKVRLGGRAAQLVAYRLDGRWVVRAYWPEVAHGRSLGDLDLVMRGESDTEAGRRDLLAVIHTVRFD